MSVWIYRLDLAVGYIVAALIAPIDAAVSYFWRRRRR